MEGRQSCTWESAGKLEEYLLRGGTSKAAMGGVGSEGGVDFSDIVGQQQSKGDAASHGLFAGALVKCTGLMGLAVGLCLLHLGGSKTFSL